MTDYRKPDAYYPPQFRKTVIVERLRHAAEIEAADKIDVQRSQIKWQADEIERLKDDLGKREREVRKATLEEAAKAVKDSEVMCEHGCNERHATIILALTERR